MKEIVWSLFLDATFWLLAVPLMIAAVTVYTVALGIALYWIIDEARDLLRRHGWL